MKRIILFLFLFFNLFPVIEKGKLTLSVPMSCLAQNEGEGGESDPCDMASPDYDENLCFLSMCDPDSNNYDEYISVCDPDSPNYDKELCCAWYSEGCDDTGGGDVCDLISPGYNEVACADDICNPSSPNYDEITCFGGGDGGICDPSSPNYDELACYGSGDGGICDPSSPYYDEMACYGGGDGGICDPASPYYDEEACYGYNTGDICDPTSPYYDEIACFGYDSGDICDPASASYNEAACSGNDSGDICDSNSTNYDPVACFDPCNEKSPNYNPIICYGSPCVYTETQISWGSENYSSSSITGNSGIELDDFDVQYEACPDILNNIWRLSVVSITGNATINVSTGGSRDPYSSPPTSESEAIDAILEMQDYYNNGRGSWHTEEASKAHEEYHYSQLKCASEHYWSNTQSNIYNIFTVPLTSYNKESALSALLAKDQSGILYMFWSDARNYVTNTVGDQPGSPGYAAGQIVLNRAIEFVQGLALQNGWTVPSGTTSINLPSPCSF